MPERLPHDSSVTLAERTGALAVVATVAHAFAVTPTLRAITIEHQRARDLAGAPGQDLMVRLAIGPDRFARRRYSVRTVDDATVTTWVSVTHEGPGAQWARSAQPGDEVDLVGPRGKIFPDPNAEWHLFIGDATAFAATYRMVEGLASGQRAECRFVVDHPGEFVAAPAPEGVAVNGGFALRQGRGPEDPEPYLRALSTVALPPGTLHAYVFGEFAAGRAVEAALVDRGVPAESISVKAFWRSGVGNAEHGEPPRE